MVKRLLLPVMLGASVAAVAATLVQQAPAPAPAPPPQPTGAFVAPSPAPAVGDPAIAGALATWRRLRQSDNLPLGDYIGFLIAWPGWPGESAMRGTVERRIDPQSFDAAGIARFFDKLPPLTNTGRARHALALAATGRTAEAEAAARAAWTGGALPPTEETLLLGRFAAQFTADSHDLRMERLLWERATATAQRQINFVSPARRPMFAARLAMQTRQADAPTLVAALGSSAATDAGYLADRAAYLRDTGQGVAARGLLAGPRRLAAPAFDPARWLNAQLLFARAAAADNQSTIAYDIARQLDDAFAPGTDVRTLALSIRDPYTSLAFIGGEAALRKLNRPRDAIALFDRYAAAAMSPQTRTRGLYWAGRAATAANDPTTANARFTEAAASADQFYGQLAAERLGRPAAGAPAAPAPADAAAFAAYRITPLARAARQLGLTGQWADQTLFLRTIATSARAPAELALAAQLGSELRRPDLGVMAARQARNLGAPGYDRSGFPTLAVPASHAVRWTMIHAITRQESQYDREAQSRVGARGLMQLMPATAREQAGKIGLPYDLLRLTKDPSYNVTLGSSFFQRMLDYYGGSHVLAIASYNAGPGNVNKWLRAYGDPRTSAVDMLDWIEAIPFEETRGYVQRVTENAVVYDSMAPSPRFPAQNRLSTILAKRTPG